MNTAPIDDEISLNETIMAIWKERVLIITLCFLALCLVILYGLIFKVNHETPTSHTFRLTGIHTNGSGSLVYPNGTAFQIQDIISSDVLAEVRERAGLNKGVDLRGYVTISHYNPIHRGVAQKYEKAVTDEDLSFAELEQLNSELLSSLNARSEKTAILYIDGSNLGIPTEISERIAFLIPEVWTSLYTKRYRILDHPQLESQGTVRVADLVNTIEILEVNESIKHVITGLNIINNDSRLSMLVSDSGFTASDILKLTSVFSDVYLAPIISQNLSRAEPFTQFYVENLRLEVEEAGKIIEGIDKTITDIRQVISGTEAKGGKTEELLDLGGGAFKDVVDLANQASLTQYLTETLSYRDDVFTKKVDLETQLAKVQSTFRLENIIIEMAQTKYEEILNEYNDLLLKARTHNAASRGVLHTNIGAPITASSPFPPRFKILLVLAIFGAGIVGTVISFVKYYARPQR